MRARFRVPDGPVKYLADVQFEVSSTILGARTLAQLDDNLGLGSSGAGERLERPRRAQGLLCEWARRSTRTMRAELRSCVPGAAACAAAALTLVAVACSTPTTETSVWKSPIYAAGPMKNIAVFGGRLNDADRRTLEDGFVSALAAYGVHATQSYTMFPQSQVPSDAASVRAKLQSAGFDGALVSTLKGVSEQALVAPDAGWAGGFDGAYWGPGAPVYAQTDQFVKFETTLWSPSSGKMVWSAITQTENPTSGRDFVSSLTKTVGPSLAKAGLIPATQGQAVSLAR